MATTTSPQPPHLLHLPLELRLEIYAHLLHLPPTISNNPSRRHKSSFSQTIHPSILLVNRQLNREATPILYSQNTFLAHPSLLTTFPRLLPCLPPILEPSLLPLIRRVHLTIRLDCDIHFTPEFACSTLSGLEELAVELVQSSFMGSGVGNLKVLEGVRGVRRVRIGGSTTGFEAYVAWLGSVMIREVGEVGEPFVPVMDRWADRLVISNSLVVAA